MLKQNLYIIILYTLLFAGGLWNQLGFFIVLMPKLSSTFIISISIFSLFLAFNTFKFQNQKLLYLIYLFIFMCSIYIEYIGVSTTLLFGHYKYQNTIQPQINNVPIAIGFAWISTMLSSIGILLLIINKLQSKLHKKKFFISVIYKLTNKSKFYKYVIILIISILNGLLMTLFDFLMEPAAIKLNYWHWFDLNIPFYNYFCWFTFGTFFTLIYISNINFNDLFCGIENSYSQLHHIYFAQCIYFFMVII